MAAQKTFSQSARPPARLGFGFDLVPQKALFFLSSVALTPSTFLDSFPSYSTLYPLFLRNRPGGTFIQSARPLARLRFGGVSIFLGALSLLFPLKPTPSTSFNSFPSYSTFRSPPQRIITGWLHYTGPMENFTWS